MIHHFDHRFGTYEGQSQAQANQGKLPELDHTAHADPGRVTLPRYWVPENEVAARLDEVWDRHWLLGWRDITGAGGIQDRRRVHPPEGCRGQLVAADDAISRSAARGRALREPVEPAVRLLRPAEGRRTSPELLHDAPGSRAPPRRPTRCRPPGRLRCRFATGSSRGSWSSPAPRGTSRRSPRIAVTTAPLTSGTRSAASGSDARSTRPSSTCTASRGRTPPGSSTRSRCSGGRRNASTASTGRNGWCWRPMTRWLRRLPKAYRTARRSGRRGGRHEPVPAPGRTAFPRS